MAVMTIPGARAPAGAAAHLEEVPARIQLTLRLLPPKRLAIESLSDACRALQAIESRYPDDEDPLSLKLHDFVEEIFALEEEIKVLPLQQEKSLGILLDKAKILIKKLRETVLVDSLFGMPLNNPVREGVWVWDAQILRACQNTYRALGITPESPLTETPFEGLEGHDFATEMLGFIRTLPAEFLLPTLHEELAIASPEELYVPIDPANMKPIKTPEETLGEILLPPEVRAPLLEGLQKSYQEQLAERINHIEGNYTIFRVNGDIARAGRRLDRTVMEIETLREVLQRVEVESKRIAAQELESRRIRSEAHTQFVIESIKAMKQAHKDEKDLLAANIAQLRRDLTETQDSLAEAKAQIENDSNRISSLEAYARNLQGQIQNLQGQLNDDGGGCSIM